MSFLVLLALVWLSRSEEEEFEMFDALVMDGSDNESVSATIVLSFPTPSATVPPYTKPPENATNLSDLEVQNFSRLEEGPVYLVGNGRIRSDDGGSFTLVYVAIFDGVVEADQLEIGEKLELFGSAILTPVEGGSIKLHENVSLTFEIQGQDKVPRLNLGKVEKSIIPSTIQIRTFNLAQYYENPSSFEPKEIVSAEEPFNCAKWYEQVDLDDPLNFGVRCDPPEDSSRRLKGTYSLLLERIPKGPAKPSDASTASETYLLDWSVSPTEEPGLRGGYIIAIGVAAVIVVIAIVIICICISNKRNSSESGEKEKSSESSNTITDSE